MITIHVIKKFRIRLEGGKKKKSKMGNSVSTYIYPSSPDHSADLGRKNNGDQKTMLIQELEER